MLYGILHTPPPATARGVCVLLLSPGIKGRIGPHRLYLKLAAQLVPAGFHVLRFDFHGLGDSEGELHEELLADVYNTIQGGRYVEDTIAAMNWMEAEHGIAQFVGSGLCGGSITALLSAARDSRIKSLLAIGLPVVLDGGEANRGRFLSTQQTVAARSEFFRRLVRPWTWFKFVSGRSNYRVIRRVFSQAFAISGPGRTDTGAGSAKGVVDDTNPLFAPAFLEYIRSRRRALLVYSGGDRLQGHFEEKFEARNRSLLEDLPAGYRIHTIPRANHIMSSDEWVDELRVVALAWLEETHPPRKASA